MLNCISFGYFNVKLVVKEWKTCCSVSIDIGKGLKKHLVSNKWRLKRCAMISIVNLMRMYEVINWHNLQTYLHTFSLR